MMPIWVASKKGDRVFFNDPALSFGCLVFGDEDRVYAEVSLMGFSSVEPFHIVLGPFAHFAAVADVVTGFLIRMEADDDDGVITVQVGDDGDLPSSSEVPAMRKFSAEMMSPLLAADLLWEAQQILDADEDPSDGVNLLESAYLGVRYDTKTEADYRAECGFHLVHGVDEANALEEIADEISFVEPAILEEPVVLKPISTRPQISPVVVAGPPEERGRGVMKNMPRAAIPRMSPFVHIDWSNLPVQVVEEQLSQQLSILMATWKRRALRAA